MPLTPSAQKFCLRLLGTFRLERDGRAINLPTHKVESLLAFLTLFPEQHSREKLAALLWGDSTDEQARHSLRTALTAIRKELGEEILLADRESVQLNSDIPIWVDAREISSLKPQASGADDSTTENLKSTIENYFDLLSDFYDDWVVRERERLRAIYIDALLQLAQYHREKGDYTQAIRFAQKVLTAEPSNEKAHQHLIFCIATQGDRIAALKQYDVCKKILHDQLNAEPSSEITVLRDQIMQELTGAPSREALLTNLPNPLTSFIGREKEIEELGILLAGTRLLTLTGVGGCGKTRLAIQIARDALPGFTHGVWWVELAALNDPALVPQQVAQVLGVRESRECPLIEMLTQFIHAKPMLIALDNCEHLLAACAELAEKLLLACPNLKIIATSREALNITGETVWRVPSLTAPDITHMPPVEELIHYDAIRLFVQRASSVESNWRLEGNESWVTRICASLNGIPLAIELAAARVKGLSVEQIAARLEDRFQLLTGGSRTASPRQQTLRGAIDWSYDLLSEKEQKLFRRLAVFVNGWTLPVATTVCSGDGIKEREIMDLLLRLTDKSLVAVMIPGGETRYHYLETIRQYALEKLDDAGESEAIRNRHLGFFVEFAESIEPKLMGAEQFTWLDRLDIEYDNLRTALDWSQSPGRAQKGLRLVGALRSFWDLRAYSSEAYQRIQKLVAQSEAAEKTLARARALFTLAVLAENFESGKAARLYLEEAIELARACGAPGKRQLAMGLAELSLFVRRDAPTRGQVLEDESWALTQELDDQWVGATILHYRGHRFWTEGDRRAARAAFEASHASFSKLGDKRWAMILYRDIARINFREGDYATARRQSEEALRFFRERKDRLLASSTLIFLGEIARMEQDYPRAKIYYEETLAIVQDLGALSSHQHVLCDLSVTVLRLGDHPRARNLLTEHLALARQSGQDHMMVFILEGFAFIMTIEHQFTRAALLFGAVDALKSRADDIYSPADIAEREHYLALARAQLDETTFNAAWEKGKAMTLAQAIEYALEETKVDSP